VLDEYLPNRTDNQISAEEQIADAYAQIDLPNLLDTMWRIRTRRIHTLRAFVGNGNSNG